MKNNVNIYYMSEADIELIKQKLVLFEEMFRDFKEALIEIEREIECQRDDFEKDIETLEEAIDEKAIDTKRNIIEDIIDRLRTI